MTALEELTDLVRRRRPTPGRRSCRSDVTAAAAGSSSPPGVVTNAHNLRDRTTSVRFADGRTVQGTITGATSTVTSSSSTSTPATPRRCRGRSTGRRATSVIAVKTAGRQRPRTTWGQVTGAERGFRGPRGRRIAGAIEHTAPSAAGSSGAPILDRGKVVAVNRIASSTASISPAPPTTTCATRRGDGRGAPRTGPARRRPRSAACRRQAAALRWAPRARRLLSRASSTSRPAPAPGSGKATSSWAPASAISSPPTICSPSSPMSARGELAITLGARHRGNDGHRDVAGRRLPRRTRGYSDARRHPFDGPATWGPRPDHWR